MDKDDRAALDSEVIEEQRKKADFLNKELILMDTTFQPDVDLSLYVCQEVDIEREYNGERGNLWYILNHMGNHYSIFETLEDAMNYIDNGDMDDRYLELSKEDIDKMDIAEC